MSVHPTLAFDDECQRAVYEYVERHGVASRNELARSVRLDCGPAQSKPARSDTYTELRPPSPTQLEQAIETLKRDGYLAETNGKLRVAVAGSPLEHETDDGVVTIRLAHEEDRDGLVETMRTVATEGTYVVAENVVDRLECEPAIVRVNEERSRVFFVAVKTPTAHLESDSRTETTAETGAETPPETSAGDVVGWLHLDAPELPSLRHTAELTVGVHPDHRREGIGSTLLEYGLEWADEAGYRKIYQSVPATNERAIDFLEANGWHREGKRKDHYLIDDSFVDEVLFATWPN